MAEETDQPAGDEPEADTGEDLDALEAEARAEEEPEADTGEGEHLPAGALTREEKIDGWAAKIEAALTSAGGWLAEVRGAHWARIAQDTPSRRDFCRDLAELAEEWLPEEVTELAEPPPELRILISAAMVFGVPVLVEVGWLPGPAPREEGAEE